RDGFADEGCVDFVDDAVQAHGAIFLHAALRLEEEEFIEVEAGLGIAHVAGAFRPALERRLAVEPSMRAVVIFAFGPGPQPAVEGFKRSGIGGGEGREELRAYGPEPAFELPFSLRLIGTRVDERDTELGAHERKMMRAIVRAIVNVKARRETS